MMAYKAKDPNSRVPRWFDWSRYCADRNSDVVGYELAIDEGPDAALIIDSPARDGNKVSFWLTGGTLHATYVVRCRVTLANGTEDDHSRTQTIAQL